MMTLVNPIETPCPPHPPMAMHRTGEIYVANSRPFASPYGPRGAHIKGGGGEEERRRPPWPGGRREEGKEGVTDFD